MKNESNNNPQNKAMQHDTLLCAAFPGTGKSYYCSNGNWSQYVPDGWCCDSDSSQFDKSNFPQNYIEHIKQRIADKYARIFISSHKEVREALVENGLKFTLIYPDKSLKQEYVNRYKEQGNSDQFITLLEKNWDNWIDECISQKGCAHIVLSSGQYVANVV